MTFNAVYFTNGGLGPNEQRYTYHVMDWQKPVTSVMSSTLGFVITAFMQCGLYGVYRLRLYLFNLYEARKTRTKHFDDIETVKGCSAGESDQIREHDTMLPVVTHEPPPPADSNSILPPIQERQPSHEEALNMVDHNRGDDSQCYVALRQSDGSPCVAVENETRS